MRGPHFVCPFIHQWTARSFPPNGPLFSLKKDSPALAPAWIVTITYCGDFNSDCGDQWLSTEDVLEKGETVRKVVEVPRALQEGSAWSKAGDRSWELKDRRPGMPVYLPSLTWQSCCTGTGTGSS